MKHTIIGLDCDDVLFEANAPAIANLNKQYNLSPPLSVYDIKSWGPTGTIVDERVKYFNDSNFVASQPVIPGAKEFIKKLITPERDVLIITAVPPEMMAIRTQRIINEFPEINPNNILMGSRKDICKVHILLDDAPHNIQDSCAEYPVLFRRPWNQNLGGMLSVNGYDEFLHLVESIERNRYKRKRVKSPSIFCLVGPSGSGKTNIVNQLVNMPNFEIPLSYTTRSVTPSETHMYKHVSVDEFINMKEKDEFFETSMYSSEYYGVKKGEIERIWNKGKHAVTAMDICGANAMKTALGNKAITLFIQKNRASVIRNVLDRPSSTEDKLNRLMALDDEYKNAEFCDYTIANNRGIEEAIHQILELI